DLQAAVRDPQNVDGGRLAADLALLEGHDLGAAVDRLVGLVADLKTGLHRGGTPGRLPHGDRPAALVRGYQPMPDLSNRVLMEVPDLTHFCCTCAALRQRVRYSTMAATANPVPPRDHAPTSREVDEGPARSTCTHGTSRAKCLRNSPAVMAPP